MATSTSSARGCGTPAEWGGSSLVFDEVNAGPWGRAAVIDGPQLSPQHGIGALSLPPVSGSGQHEEQRAPRGAARKANASVRTTANRCTERIFTDERSKACRSFPRIVKRWLTALPGGRKSSGQLGARRRHACSISWSNRSSAMKGSSPAER